MEPMPGVVRAVMQSGKSKTMSEVVASCLLEDNEVIVVTTSTQKLVRQLTATLRERLDDGLFALGAPKVGMYYADDKDVSANIIVACNDSAPNLAVILKKQGREVALWIPDECHRSNNATINTAHATMQPHRTVGFTATPFTASEDKRLSLFQPPLIYDYGVKEALRDGVIVMPEFIPWTGAEVTIDEACMQQIQGAPGPGIVSARSIFDAEKFAQELTARGMKAAAVHSKLTPQENDARIEMLRRGDLKVITQVNMLSEGVSVPWLRWLCLRTPIGSRVQFCQFVGRAVCAFNDSMGFPVKGPDGTPLKTKALIYDPHDLAEILKLSYEAVLGGEVEAVEPATEVEVNEGPPKSPEDIDAEGLFGLLSELKEGERVTGNAKKLDPAYAYLRKMVMLFDTAGVLGDRKIDCRTRRNYRITDKQQKALSSMMWTLRFAPEPHRSSLQKLLSLKNIGTIEFNRGNATDALDLMFALSRTKKWPELHPAIPAADPS